MGDFKNPFAQWLGGAIEGQGIEGDGPLSLDSLLDYDSEAFGSGPSMFQDHGIDPGEMAAQAAGEMR